MILVIHFNIFHVKYMSPKKTEIAFVRQKLLHGRHHLLPKNTECVYVRQGHVAAQNFKNIILSDIGCRPCDKFCRLKKQKLNSGDISSSDMR